MPSSQWWKIGWRNVGRHKRRTLLTSLALAVGYAAVVLMVGWVDGIVSQMVSNGTGVITGQIQIQNPEYLPERSLFNTLGGFEGTSVTELLDALESDAQVDAASARVYAGGLLSSGDATVAGFIIGVDAEREARVTRILGSLVRGRLPEPGANELVVGEEMARKLGSDVGDELVVVAPAADGSLGNDLFDVVGVYHSGMPDLDASFAIASIEPMQFMVALEPNQVHEVALAVSDPWGSPAIAQRVEQIVAAQNLEANVRPWTEFRPEIVDYANMSRGAFWIIVMVVFGMAAFGVANTMLMAAFERRREFAVLLALGAKPSGVLRSLIYESASLGMLSLIVGVVLVAPLMYWFHNWPPDLTNLVGGFTFAGAFVRPVLKVEYSIVVPLQAAIVLLLTAVAAAVYPA
ncbi:MAG: ABC transporter permease, partial [Gemmatimonadota bacterium]|nr:ABC transporter permease [Gemmatimonadota bacterium]